MAWFDRTKNQTPHPANSLFARVPRHDTSRERTDWRGRDDRIVEQSRRHPSTNKELRHLVTSCQTEAAAEAVTARRTRRLTKRGRIRLLGYVMRCEVGRPLAVYGWHPVKQENLLHEVELTRAWLAITRNRQHTALRLDSVDQYRKPDMELWMEGDHYYVELDRGTVSHRAQAKRWELYRTVDDRHHELLVITTSEARMDELIKHADAVRHIARFTVLETLLETPKENVWIDCSGARHRV